MGARRVPAAALLVVAITAAGCEVLFPLDDPRSPPDALPPPGCPPGYVPVGDTWYRYAPAVEQGWLDAATLCALDSTLAGPGWFTHLAVIGSDVERLSMEVHVSTGPSAWIGRSDRLQENMFQWVTLEDPAYDSPWEPGQPDSGAGTGEQDCLRTYAPGVDDDYCTQAQPFLCECDQHENQPNRY